MISREDEEVDAKQEMAVSISSPGKSSGENKGARERASAMRCVLPGVHCTLKLYMDTLSLIHI